MNFGTSRARGLHPHRDAAGRIASGVLLRPFPPMREDRRWSETGRRERIGDGTASYWLSVLRYFFNVFQVGPHGWLPCGRHSAAAGGYLPPSARPGSSTDVP